jgi:peptidoglycan/LPS O-acetylase OafA/YrhL/glycosyltransferase involved in cell wall biosynthesis
MRVMHIVSGRLYGGVETLLVMLARSRGLCAAMEPEFALCFDGRLREELAASDVAIHLLGGVRARHPLSVLRARRRLRAVLNARSIDVVVCHLPWTQAIFGPVVRAAGIPLAFWMHGEMNGRTWLDRWAAMTPPDAAICNSKYTANSLPMIFPRVPSKVIYIPVTHSDQNRSAQDRLEVRLEFDTPAEATVIVQVGRIERLKGHLVHLEALSQLREVPEWIAWFVGGAQRPDEVAYEAELKAAANAMEVSDRVRFVGERSDVAKILAASDIYCQPNIAPEGFGIAFIEALYSGLPVVTSALGGSLEIVDSSCGILVPPRKPEAVADALGKLIRDRDLRIRLGAAGPARANQLTDPAVQMSLLHTTLEGFSDRAKSASVARLQHPAETRFKFTYLPQLDGLRGMAVILVIVGHLLQFSKLQSIRLGEGLAQFGVMLFFVLSGFLITGILLRERLNTNRVDLRAFYQRRVLRLAPALLVFLATMSVLKMTGAVRDVPWYEFAVCLLYVRNIWGRSSSLGHLWTLSMEEQFYITWPLLVARIRPAQLLVLAIGLTLLCNVWRFVAIDRAWFDYNHGIFYLRPYFRFDSILIGCCLALVMSEKFDWIAGIARRVAQPVPIIAVWIAAICWLEFGEDFSRPLFITVQTYLAVLILFQLLLCASPLYLGIMRHESMRYMGKISYAFYLWQQIFLVTKTPSWGLLREFPFNLAAAFVLAAVSYRFVESPFLRLKECYSEVIQGDHVSAEIGASGVTV